MVMESGKIHFWYLHCLSVAIVKQLAAHLKRFVTAKNALVSEKAENLTVQV
jgi:hypothetical protein